MVGEAGLAPAVYLTWQIYSLLSSLLELLSREKAPSFTLLNRIRDYALARRGAASLRSKPRCLKLVPSAGLEPAIHRLRPGAPSRGSEIVATIKESAILRSNGCKWWRVGVTLPYKTACKAGALLVEPTPLKQF